MECQQALTLQAANALLDILHGFAIMQELVKLNLPLPHDTLYTFYQ